MSIINDALKKVQRSLKDRDAAKTDEPEDRTEETITAAVKTPLPDDEPTEHLAPKASASPGQPPRQRWVDILLIAVGVAIGLWLLTAATDQKKDASSKELAVIQPLTGAEQPPEKEPAAEASPAEVIPAAAAPADTPPSATPDSPPPVKSSLDGLVIGGVVTMDDRQVALIDGGIYEVGDHIRGGEIFAITPDAVAIMEHGEIRTFRVRR